MHRLNWNINKIQCSLSRDHVSGEPPYLIWKFQYKVNQLMKIIVSALASLITITMDGSGKVKLLSQQTGSLGRLKSESLNHKTYVLVDSSWRLAWSDRLCKWLV